MKAKPGKAAAKEPATEPATATDRPPPIFGFALHLLGTGCAFLAVAQLGIFFEVRGASALAPWPWRASVIGQLMVLLGLGLGWRTTRTKARRLLAVATTLWLALFVIDFERERLQDYLIVHARSAMMAPHSGPLAGRAIALGLLAFVVHRGARAVAAPTWATTLGVALVVADAWARTWPVLTGMRAGTNGAALAYAPPAMVAGAAGFLLVGAGLFAAGKTILAAGETAAASPPGAPAGLSLLADAMVSVAGTTLALFAALAGAAALGLAPRDVGATTAMGGMLVSLVLLAVALRRMKLPAALAYAALAALVVQAALLYFVPASVAPTLAGLLPLLLVAASLYRAAGAVAGAPDFVRHARSAALALGVAAALGAASAFTDPSVVAVTAALASAFALYAAVSAARAAYRERGA